MEQNDTSKVIELEI